MKIPIDKIKVQPGRRKAKPEAVEELAQSMADAGMVNPITIDADHRLVAGLHRLEAAKLLGWTQVDCSVLEMDALHAKLVELDENIFRTPLTELELSELLMERKKIYEALHPERRHGGDRRSAAVKPPNWRNAPVRSFAEDTAQLLGVSPRTVERHIQIAQKLTPGTKMILKEAEANLTQQTLEKLTRLGPAQQEEAAGLLAQGKIKTVDQYFSPPQQENGAENSFANATLYMEAFGKAVLQLQRLLETFQKRRENCSGRLSTEYLDMLESQAVRTVTALNGFIEGLKHRAEKPEPRRIS